GRGGMLTGPRGRGGPLSSVGRGGGGRGGGAHHGVSGGIRLASPRHSVARSRHALLASAASHLAAAGRAVPHRSRRARVARGLSRPRGSARALRPPANPPAPAPRAPAPRPAGAATPHAAARARATRPPPPPPPPPP